MRYLIIWEVIPEETKLYLVDADKHESTMLENINEKFIGCDDIDDLFVINDMLCNDSEYCRVPEASHNCKWSKCLVSTPINIDRDVKVIKSGIWL